MPTSLSKEHRKLLENTTSKAHVLAESACRAALENLAVHEKDYRAHMSVEQRLLRNRLRARGRAIGDTRDERSGIQDIRHLTELAAYEHWHRLLFTRFLTENHLLITNEANGNVPVTLEECEELAQELGARDGQDLACRFASFTLPGVFRRNDPVLDLPIALNDQVELRKLLAALPAETFRADDALGWTYQFWQAKRKEDINKTNKKRGADEIPAVTQLFTEDYMVEFLLHNTLGAWWVGKLGPIHAATEEEARAKATLSAKDGLGITWTYLRFIQDEKAKTWLPAAGTFDGWSKQAKLIKFLDPCMGSGHFLVFALPILVRMRMEEEKLSVQEAVVAVLEENIHGLELDERCAQIAAFNLALASWKIGGYQPLPSLHLACSGLAPRTAEKDWVALAGKSDKLKAGMAQLYSLFKDAPVLGSLINPRAAKGDLLVATFHELQPLLEKALAQETKDDTAHEMAVTARGVAKAAEILAGQFTLVSTNVPYLGLKKMEESLRDHCETNYPRSKADLAAVFSERSLDFCGEGGSIAVVTPQTITFLGTFVSFRKNLMEEHCINILARLGIKAFQAMMYDFTVSMWVATQNAPTESTAFCALDVSEFLNAEQKSENLEGVLCRPLVQSEQLKNPDSRITVEELGTSALLEKIAISPRGVVSGDIDKWLREFWEFEVLTADWRFLQTAVNKTEYFSGCHQVIDWSTGGEGMLRPGLGNKAYGKRGVAVSRMAALPSALYLGELYDQNTSVLVPYVKEHLAALWVYCSSQDFNAAVRKLDQKVGVTPATLLKIPFDLPHWQKMAADKYPDGLPKPFSSDPTQWLFNGHPAGADQPLHVAVARLLGYQWPRQTGSTFPDCPVLKPDGLEKLADDDGIVCLPPLNREQPAAARLRQLLTAAIGKFNERDLIASAGLKGGKSKTIEEWLRDEFFEQHSTLFHDRPFIWHLWDGRSDGFHVFVNYHKLDHALLQKLTYAYLGNWIQQQSDDVKADKPGAAERLGAARELQAELAKILEGEALYDLFVRWKPLAKQAQGWNPDLNDGVRMNIRPFLTAQDVGKKGAGLLRIKPNIKWDKDRGTEPQRPKSDYPWFWCKDEPDTDPTGGKDFIGDRWNNVHLTLDFKRKARA